MQRSAVAVRSIAQDTAYIGPCGDRQMMANLLHMPREAATLQENEVHIWLVDLDNSAVDSVAIREILPDEEIARAGRYAQAYDKRRFMGARIALKKLLSMYQSTPASEIALFYEARGKPFVRSGAGASRLEFSLAHSGNLALYAFTLNSSIGVDIEAVRDIEEIDFLARTILSAEEYTAFCTNSVIDRTELFYRYWTCKEAVIKLRDGTLQEMRQIEVSPGSCSTSGWIEARCVASPPAYAVRELDGLPGYSTALARENTTAKLRFWIVMPNTASWTC